MVVAERQRHPSMAATSGGGCGVWRLCAKATGGGAFGASSGGREGVSEWRRRCAHSTLSSSFASFASDVCVGV